MSTAIATGAVPAEELLGRRRWVRVAASKSSAARAAEVASGALANHPFWEPHCAGLTQFIVWDVDHSDGWLRAWSLAPEMEPTAVIEHGGRAQVLVRIEAVATGPRARSAPQEWLRTVERAGADLLDADPAFSGVRCRSPWWTGPDPGDGVEVTVTWGRSAAARRPRSLTEVMAGLEAARTRLEDGPDGIWAEAPDPADPASLGGRRRPALLERAIAARRRSGHGAGVEAPDTGTIHAGTRNVGLFWGVALPMAHRGLSADEIEAALSAESRVRCSPPLGAAEIAGIARSAVRQAARHPDTGGGFTPAERAVLARWGRRGGQARTPAKAVAAAAAAERGRAAQTAARIDRAGMITQMTAAGLSARRIAANLGVSISTVRRARAAGRAEQGTPEGGVIREATGIRAPLRGSPMMPMGAPEPAPQLHLAWNIANTHRMALRHETQAEDSDAGAMLPSGHAQARQSGLLVRGEDAEDNLIRIRLVCKLVQDRGEGRGDPSCAPVDDVPSGVGCRRAEAPVPHRSGVDTESVGEVGDGDPQDLTHGAEVCRSSAVTIDSGHERAPPVGGEVPCPAGLPGRAPEVSGRRER